MDSHQSWQIRPVEAADWQQYRETRLAALLDAPSAFARTHEEEAAYTDGYWQHIARERSNGEMSGMFVAVDGNGRFGAMAGGYRPEPESSPRSAELVSMWVAPAGRRHGLARELIDAVEQWARERACERIELWVTHGNDPAIALYERAGFVVTGDVAPLPSDPCKDEIRMRKLLT